MNSRDIEKFVRKNIRELCPYSTARDEFQGGIGVFLDANESPYNNGFNRYPDPHQKALKEKIGKLKDLPTENIFLGNGSDEAIDLMFRIFCNPSQDNAVMISPSYGMYEVSARINDVQVRKVPLGESFAFSGKALLSACNRRTKLIFICSPNNPTGNAFECEEILSIVDTFNGIVVVDEAYADFSMKGSLRAEVLNRPNLVILQTLSKAWGLAGLRLGMAFADSYIISLMSRVKYPYNINKAALDAVGNALDHPVDRQVREIIVQRSLLAAKIGRLNFVQKVYPSDANFLLVKTADADALYNHLIADGIIVRNRNKVEFCGGCVRISIGLPAENERLLLSLKEYEKGNICR